MEIRVGQSRYLPHRQRGLPGRPLDAFARGLHPLAGLLKARFRRFSSRNRCDQRECQLLPIQFQSLHDRIFERSYDDTGEASK